MSYYFCQFQVISENILGLAFFNGRATRILSTCVGRERGSEIDIEVLKTVGNIFSLDAIDVEDCFWPSFGAER